jgi:citrate lyase subunit beta/citryl-CoA lyase
MMAKGANLPVDQVFLDLEDSVAPTAKPSARDDVVSALRDQNWSGKTRVVRINDCTTPWTLRDLDVVITGAGGHLDAIMLPKVQFAGQVHFVDHMITQLEVEQGLPVGGIGLELQIENAQGLVNAREILAASSRTETFIFGPGDMAAALGMPELTVGAMQPNYPGDHWHGVLFTILIHARNAGVQAIDGPYARIKDIQGFREVALRSRTLGFDGKWVLHPDQVTAGNEIFSVPLEDFERAGDIMDAYQLAITDAGVARGAIMFGEEMIDEASRKMAESTVARGRAQGLQARPVDDSVPFHERAAARDRGGS